MTFYFFFLKGFDQYNFVQNVLCGVFDVISKWEGNESNIIEV